MDWGPLIYSSRLQRELSALICCLFGSPNFFTERMFLEGDWYPG